MNESFDFFNPSPPHFFVSLYTIARSVASLPMGLQACCFRRCDRDDAMGDADLVIVLIVLTYENPLLSFPYVFF